MYILSKILKSTQITSWLKSHWNSGKCHTRCKLCIFSKWFFLLSRILNICFLIQSIGNTDDIDKDFRAKTNKQKHAHSYMVINSFLHTVTKAVTNSQKLQKLRGGLLSSGGYISSLTLSTSSSSSQSLYVVSIVVQNFQCTEIYIV